jgi:hypothetical protein
MRYARDLTISDTNIVAGLSSTTIDGDRPADSTPVGAPYRFEAAPTPEALPILFDGISGASAGPTRHDDR